MLNWKLKYRFECNRNILLNRKLKCRTQERNKVITLLKKKNESNSTWVTVNSFPLIKRTFSSWVHFTRKSDLKNYTHAWVFCIKSNLIKIKSEVSVYWTYNWVYAFDFNIHADQGCTGIKPVLLSSADGQKQSMLTIRLRRNTSTRNNDNYIERRSNFVTTGMKVMSEL